MKKVDKTIIIENRREVELLKNVLEIASYGNFLTSDERKISHELSKMLDDMYKSE